MGRCLICNRGIQDSLTLAKIVSFKPYKESCICERCTQLFQEIHRNQACPGCSRLQDDMSDCRDCIKWKEKVVDGLVTHEAFFRYDDVLKNWMQVYKFQGDTRYARIMADPLQGFYRKHKDAVVVPMPSSKASMDNRGFNQCEELLKYAGIPYVNLISNVSRDKKQSEKNRMERMQTGQPFQLNELSVDHSKSLLLFDDIYTTGRTLIHAKELLWEAGFTAISSFSIGR
ncbi:ComF family protein [Jeotgalibaca sp. A122]|uniref:ComF family protein n=2 Tax=unclassified Jeotgalibaca TaxID=2621505 RepID=UPI003FD54232